MERFSFVKREHDKLLAMALVMEPVSKWSSGQVVDWMKGKATEAKHKRMSPGSGIATSAASVALLVEMHPRTDSREMPRENKTPAEPRVFASSARAFQRLFDYSLNSSDRFVVVVVVFFLQFQCGDDLSSQTNMFPRASRTHIAPNALKPLLCPAVGIVNEGLPRRSLGNIAETRQSHTNNEPLLTGAGGQILYLEGRFKLYVCMHRIKAIAVVQHHSFVQPSERNGDPRMPQVIKKSQLTKKSIMQA